MSDLQIYSKASVYINSKQLTEEAEVTVKHISGLKKVGTVAKGLAGWSQGMAEMEIKIKNAVPSAGFEYSPFKAMQNAEVIEITIFAASQTCTTKGVIVDSEFTHGVDKESSLDVSIEARFAAFE